MRGEGARDITRSCYYYPYYRFLLRLLTWIAILIGGNKLAYRICFPCTSRSYYDLIKIVEKEERRFSSRGERGVGAILNFVEMKGQASMPLYNCNCNCIVYKFVEVLSVLPCKKVCKQPVILP